MARKHRLAPPGLNLHVTQRGNYRQQTFFTPRDYHFFLSLVAQHAPRRSVDILAYCLMPNHFHLVLTGHHPGSVSRFMQAVNGQCAQDIHRRLHRQGRFWQNRFYSCVLDNAHLVAALRYVELNPVRANMVSHPTDHRWSSAAIHSGDQAAPPWIQMSTFNELFTPAEWRHQLLEGQPLEEQTSIRTATKYATSVLVSGDNYFSLPTTTISPYRRQLQPLQSSTDSLDWC